MNTNIYQNFVELANKENFRKKENYKKWLPEDQMTESMFYDKINIVYLKEDKIGQEGIKKIDIFVKEKVELYPNLYPYISLKPIKKYNFNKKTGSYNNKQVKCAKSYLKEGRTLDAMKHLMLKKFRIDFFENFNFRDDTEKKECYKAVSNIDTQITIDSIVNKLELEIKSKFYEFLFDDEIKILSNLMGLEIYLRANKPLKYSKIFFEIEEHYNLIEQTIIHTILKPMSNDILANDNSKNGIEKAIEAIENFIKK